MPVPDEYQLCQMHAKSGPNLFADWVSVYETVFLLQKHRLGLAYTQESYFHAVDKNFNLKLSKLLYYIKMSRLFADVLMFKN